MCQTTNQRVERKKLGKLPFEILVFFFFLIIFGFWAEKTWTFSKTEGKILEIVAYRCRRTFSENFLEAKILLWKFSVIEWKHRISDENVFSGLSKAQFTCPVQHFEKMMIKVNFTFCGLFRTLCVFFLWQDNSHGCQNHKLSVQRKNFMKFFSVANVFSKHFQSLSRDTWSFSKKVPAWLSQVRSMGPDEHFGITIWGKFLNISIFSEN